MEKLHAFRTSVAEVDQLHDVILDLTEDGLEKQRKLNEEKERYRLAVKGTNDAFFTYHPKTGAIEITNSPNDGEFDSACFWDLFRRESANPEAVDAIEQAVNRMQETSIQVEVVTEHLPQGRWLEVSSSRVDDAASGQDCMVCVIHDIDDRKRREIESARKRRSTPQRRHTVSIPAWTPSRRRAQAQLRDSLPPSRSTASQASCATTASPSATCCSTS